MGFRFRRSVRLLPGIRLNLSGSGASVSLGARGFHYTVGAKGTRVTAGIPGTGLSWTQYTPHAQPRAVTSVVPPNPLQSEQSPPSVDPINPSLNAIESAPAEQINSLSVGELAPLLDSANRRVRVAPFVQLVSVLIFVVALLQANQLAMGLAALYSTIMVPIGIFLDRYRRSVRITYEPHGPTGQIADALRDAFGDLVASHTIWRIRAEGSTRDWKRNAGATTLSQRKMGKAQFGKPDCIRGRSEFPALKLGTDEIYFLPDAALVIVRGSVAAVHYRDLEITKSVVRFIEEEGVPTDSPTVGQTWRYVNKDGGPDRRFTFNTQLPICLYADLSFQSEGGLNAKVQCSNPSAPDRLCAVLDVLHRSNAELPKAITYVKRPKWWMTAVFVSSSIVFGVGQIAYFSKDIARLLPQPSKVSAVPDQKRDTSLEKPRVDVQANRADQTRIQGTKATSASSEPLKILPPTVEVRPSPLANQMENVAPLVGTVPLPRPRPKLAKKNAAE